MRHKQINTKETFNKLLANGMFRESYTGLSGNLERDKELILKNNMGTGFNWLYDVLRPIMEAEREWENKPLHKRIWLRIKYKLNQEI